MLPMLWNAFFSLIVIEKKLGCLSRGWHFSAWYNYCSDKALLGVVLVENIRQGWNFLWGENIPVHFTEILMKEEKSFMVFSTGYQIVNRKKSALDHFVNLPPRQHPQFFFNRAVQVREWELVWFGDPWAHGLVWAGNNRYF